MIDLPLVTITTTSETSSTSMSKREHSPRSSKKASKKHKKKRSRSRSRSDRKHERKKRSRDRSCSSRRSKHRKSGEDAWSLHNIDKEKLLEIAQSNLGRLITANSSSEPATQVAQERSSLGVNQSRTNSVTDFIKLCKNLQASGQSAEVKEEIEDKRIRVRRIFEQIRPFSSQESLSTPTATSQAKIADACKAFPVSSGIKHRKIVQEVRDEALGVMTTPASDGQPAAAGGDLSFGEEEMPGKFSRDSVSGVKLLTPDELEGDYKAWVRKDYLMKAEPIKSAIGMKLMEKMGWKSGQGLGKNQEGPLEPIKIVIKVDRKGLVGPKTWKTPINTQPASAASIGPQDDKNPISMLGEYCAARKWPQPLYVVTHESGPAHLKNFQMKVIVNRTEYLNNQLASTKKQAKTNAAVACLNQMGLLAQH